jgi:hypothetical protein
MIALFSAAFAATRMYKLRRKNRIDTYYAKVMEIRRRAPETALAGERVAATRELRALQNNAFEQLIADKLAADDSFRIFITMSNDLIRELSAER